MEVKLVMYPAGLMSIFSTMESQQFKVWQFEECCHESALIAGVEAGAPEWKPGIQTAL